MVDREEMERVSMDIVAESHDFLEWRRRMEKQLNEYLVDRIPSTIDTNSIMEEVAASYKPTKFSIQESTGSLIGDVYRNWATPIYNVRDYLRHRLINGEITIDRFSELVMELMMSDPEIKRDGKYMISSFFKRCPGQLRMSERVSGPATRYKSLTVDPRKIEITVDRSPDTHHTTDGDIINVIPLSRNWSKRLEE